MITVIKRAAYIALLLSVSGYSRADARQTPARNRIAAMKPTNFANQSTPAPADVTAKVDAFIQPLIDSEVVSGLAIGLIDGDKTYILGYGSVSASHPGKPDGSTLYEIGSVTKVFTGTLLADMVGRREAQLADPIAKYLPSTAKTPTFEGTPITLLDLATQSSGLPRLPDNLAPQNPADPYADCTGDKLLAFLSGYKLARKPGAQYEYSNLGMGLLGYALANHLQKPYEALIKQRVCEPLGMTSTGLALNAEQRTRLAAGHDTDGNVVSNWDMGALAGAGGLRSDVKDMLRFAQANLYPESGLIPPILQSALLLAQKPERPVDGGSQIGLAWHILPDGKTIWHNGGTGGYRSLVAFNREKKQGVVVLCNTADDVVDPVGFGLLRMLGGDALPTLKLRLPAKINTGVYSGYVGEYELAPGAMLAITREQNKLMAQLTGQGKYRLYPASETNFFYRIVDAQVTFVKDGSGKVEKLILHQSGRDLPANKVK